MAHCQKKSWQNGKLMKWQIDEMANWWNGKLMKWQIDEMANWWNGKLKKLLVGKMANEQTFDWTSVDKMASTWSVSWQNGK